MKHQYTTEQLQAAIDAACVDTHAKFQRLISVTLVLKRDLANIWNEETPARLHLAEKLLELLPETTPPVVDWKARAEKAEAELVSLRAGFDRAKESIAEARQKSLSTLRPIAEAGEVPAGAVRVLGYCNGDKWNLGIAEYQEDTHFADIRVPVGEAPAEVIHDGGEVFPVAPWTPSVGDVVTLKSGGPKMTVNKSAAADENALCNYFDADGKLHASYFPSSTLIKA